MLQRLAGRRMSSYIQAGTNVLAVLFTVLWFAMLGFVALQGAFEVAGLVVVFTVLIIGLAYANERSE